MLPHVSFHQEFASSRLQNLLRDLEDKCRGNLRDFAGKRVLVEGGGYGKIWLETQPMGGEMYALRDPEAARNNTELFMLLQREDGRLPGSVECIGSRLEPQFNKVQGFCFPAPAMELYYLLGRDPAWLDALRSCLMKFDAWLWRTRDSNGDGLLESYCVYDTGEDNALRYGDAPCWWTEDSAPTGCSVVPMASMDVMSWSWACRDTLSRIARLLGSEQDALLWRQQADETASALRRGLWDEQAGTCFDIAQGGSRVSVLCHNPLRCMYWGSFSQDMAERFVREHLLRADEFNTPMPLPSVAVRDPLFRNAPENNWSGQSEGLTWQRAIDALENYGMQPLLTRLGKRFLRALCEAGGVYAQQFDPFTGRPSRVGKNSHLPLADGDPSPVQDAYGPTMLAGLKYLERLYGISLHSGEIWFGLCSGESCACRAEWNDRSWRLENDGRRAILFADGKELLRCDTGVRVIVSPDGSVLRTVPLETPEAEQAIPV